MLSPELQVWIKERNPHPAAEAARLANVFAAARGTGLHHMGKEGQPQASAAVSRTSHKWG